jgi:hypothetical protein
MSSCLSALCKPWRIASVLALTSLLSAWTCTAVVNFESCPGTVPQPQIASLSPSAISADANSVLLLVDGASFVRQSKILWNGNPLETTFLDSRHLQTTITQETLDSFGGSDGSSVLISVSSPQSVSIEGCRNAESSGTLVLSIN